MKNKIIKLCGFVILCLLLIGCNKENNEVSDEGTLKPSNSEEREKLVRKCEVAAQSAYNVYKTNHSGEIIESFCDGTMEGTFQIYFKVTDKKIYQYKYSFDEDRIIGADNDLTHTENYDAYIKICNEGNATTYQELVCSQQKLLLQSYDTVKKLSTNNLFNNKYAELDISKLK